MFEPENDLERSFVRAANEPANRPQFFRKLIDAEVFIAFEFTGEPPVAGPDGQATLTKDTTLNFRWLRKDDQLFVPFFTAPVRAHAIIHGNHVVAPEKTSDLFKRFPEAQFALNPGSEFSKEFSHDDVVRLLGGQFEEGLQTIVVDKLTEVLLSHPKVKPKALIEALAREFSSIKGVRGAWLMLAAYAGGPDQNWILGVDHVGDWAQVRAAINRAVVGDVLQGRLLDAIHVEDSELSGTLRTGIPVIIKKRGFFNLFR